MWSHLLQPGSSLVSEIRAGGSIRPHFQLEPSGAAVVFYFSSGNSASVELRLLWQPTATCPSFHDGIRCIDPFKIINLTVLSPCWPVNQVQSQDFRNTESKPFEIFTSLFCPLQYILYWHEIKSSYLWMLISWQRMDPYFRPILACPKRYMTFRN